MPSSAISDSDTALNAPARRGVQAGAPAPGLVPLLVLPFAYYFRSRLPQRRQKVGWALGYVLPVLGLAAAAHGGLAGLLPAALMMVAVYAAYEFGYLVNDTRAIEREAAPTLRLPPEMRTALRDRLVLAAAARLATGLVLIALLAAWQGPAVAAAAAGWAALWPLFALYNRWRGRITIPLHFSLVALRYGLPIAAAAPDLGAAALAPLLLLYAVPSTFEAAWKPRYGLTGLKTLVGGAHPFRLGWTLALALSGLAAARAWPGLPSALFAGGALYYLLFRAGAFALRHERAPVATKGGGGR